MKSKPEIDIDFRVERFRDIQICYITEKEKKEYTSVTLNIKGELKKRILEVLDDKETIKKHNKALKEASAILRSIRHSNMSKKQQKEKLKQILERTKDEDVKIRLRIFGDDILNYNAWAVMGVELKRIIKKIPTLRSDKEIYALIWDYIKYKIREFKRERRLEKGELA